MAKMTMQELRDLPNSKFALPEERRFAIATEGQAREALERVENTGTRNERARVRAAVDAAYPNLSDADE